MIEFMILNMDILKLRFVLLVIKRVIVPILPDCPNGKGENIVPHESTVKPKILKFSSSVFLILRIEVIDGNPKSSTPTYNMLSYLYGIWALEKYMKNILKGVVATQEVGGNIEPQVRESNLSWKMVMLSKTKKLFYLRRVVDLLNPAVGVMTCRGLCCNSVL